MFGLVISRHKLYAACRSNGKKIVERGLRLGLLIGHFELPFTSVSKRVLVYVWNLSYKNEFDLHGMKLRVKHFHWMISFDNLFPHRKGAIAKWPSQFLIKKTLKDFRREMAVLRSLRKRIPSSFCFAFFARYKNSLKKMNCFSKLILNCFFKLVEIQLP